MPDQTQALAGVAVPRNAVPCEKCHGSGRYAFVRNGRRGDNHCFSCNGQGKIYYVMDERAGGAMARKTNQASRLADWRAEHPEELAYLARKASSWPFAESMLRLIERFGDLTKSQMQDVQRALQIDKDHAETDRQIAAQRAAFAQLPMVDVRPIKDLLDRCKAQGMIKPMLRFDKLQFSLAPDEGQNPGAIYVTNRKTQGDYYGKAIGGRFRPSGACNAETMAEIIDIVNDPKAAAVKFGRLTQCCSMCGKRLSDPKSVKNGFGPICAARVGWAFEE